MHKLKPDLLSMPNLNRRDQNGINMVDLMMWLVIAALLLAAAIQGIGYYQKAAYLYQIKSDLYGAGSVTMSKVAEQEGKITTAALNSGTSDTEWSEEITHTVISPTNGAKPYILASHPAITDRDGIYLFDPCGDDYPIGVSIIPKGGNPTLSACGVSADPADGSATPGTPTADDLDGDGIPNASDPDIDGDGTPNESDTTPNGATDSSGTGGTGTEPGAGDGSTATPVSNTTCVDLSASEEAACWIEIIYAEEISFSDANDKFYFGYTRDPSMAEHLYTGSAMDTMPLKHREETENYRNASNPEYNYGVADIFVIDRDGNMWNKELYHDTSGFYPSGINDEYENINYNCYYIAPNTMLSKSCKVQGLNPDEYSTSIQGGDATAIADVEKVINAQFEYAKANAGALYGGSGAPADVTSWAGTTNTAKVWNDITSTRAYTRVMVTLPNGDLYTAKYDWSTSAPAMSLPIVTYTHAAAKVNDICTRPYVTNLQQQDIKSCQSIGYPDFKAV